MKHPERVHSRSQLLDKVWGDHVFIEERTVDVHVKRLRESLGGGRRDDRDRARRGLPAGRAVTATPRPSGRRAGACVTIAMAWRFCASSAGNSPAGLLGLVAGHDRGARRGWWPARWSGSRWTACAEPRVLQWLRRGDVTGTPAVGGLWGEVVDRARRALRVREQEAVDARAPAAGFPGGDPGFAQRRGAARSAGPHRMVQPDGGRPVRLRPAARPDAAGRQPGARPCVHGLLQQRRGTGTRSSSRARAARRRRPVKLSVHLHPYGEGRKLLLSRDVTAVEQAEIMRRDFVANVSHEIRTPLTVLMGFVETLQNLPLDAQGPRALPGPDGAAGATHADPGQRPADAVAAGRQPACPARANGRRWRC